MPIPDFYKNKDRKCNSVVEHVLSMLKTLGLILSSGKKKIIKLMRIETLGIQSHLSYAL